LFGPDARTLELVLGAAGAVGDPGFFAVEAAGGAGVLVGTAAGECAAVAPLSPDTSAAKSCNAELAAS